jgi:hypothetical protein
MSDEYVGGDIVSISRENSFIHVYRIVKNNPVLKKG